MNIIDKGNELCFDENLFIVSKTDLKGKITYGNDLFIEISGYSEKELIGAPHNILRHDDMPRAVFKLLWDRIQSGKEVFAYVKNRAKSGQYYWVHAYVTPIVDSRKNEIIGYHSVRRKPASEALQTIKSLYTQLLDAEREGGLGSSQILLDKTLSTAGKNYDQFIIAL